MRTWHRWIMTVVVLALSYWVGSGLVMATYDATDATQVWAIEGGGPGARLTDAARTAQAIPEPALLATPISTALATVGTMPYASVDLRMVGDTPRLELAEASGERATMQRFYADTAAPMTQQVADGDTGAKPPDNVLKRNTLKAWHRGNIIGMPGQILGLLVGLSLIALVVTGVVLYFKLWFARRKAGRLGFFWTARESLWRRLHRWVAIVAAAFIFNIAVSGSILAYGEIQLNVFLQHGIGAPPYPRPTPVPPRSEAPLPHDVNAMLESAYRAARIYSPNGRITAVQLVVHNGIPKGLVTLGGTKPRILAFDAASGAEVTDWASGGVQVGNGYFADWHQALKRFHRGDILGSFAARYVDLAAGLALLYLVVSSFFLYFDLRKRRQQTGRSQWFWK
jgi:uncharacterized iron-regulated membrane protein